LARVPAFAKAPAGRPAFAIDRAIPIPNPSCRAYAEFADDAFVLLVAVTLDLLN